MPVVLKDPIVTPTADAAKVAAFKVEDNVEKWIIIWVIRGAEVDGVFVENKALPTLEFKIENGHHPFQNGRALSRCPDCDKWYGLEQFCTSCGAETLPYDGFTRLAMAEPSGANMYSAIKNGLYSFLTTEHIPKINADGTLGELVVLLDVV